jgi:hypothetical protein
MRAGGSAAPAAAAATARPRSAEQPILKGPSSFKIIIIMINYLTDPLNAQERRSDPLFAQERAQIHF